MILSFFAAGTPVPQGSKHVMIRHRSRQPIAIDDKRLGPWRSTVAGEALRARQAQHCGMFEGPVAVLAVFAIRRPPSHLKKSGLRKTSAPARPTAKFDVDKLLRGLLDSLTGVIWQDDGQVVTAEALKVYTRDTEGVFVEVKDQATEIIGRPIGLMREHGFNVNATFDQDIRPWKAA